MLAKMSTEGTAIEYKKFIFQLINNLNMVMHEPGENVIKQNESVLNDQEVMIEESEMFFILTGKYKV